MTVLTGFLYPQSREKPIVENGDNPKINQPNGSKQPLPLHF